MGINWDDNNVKFWANNLSNHSFGIDINCGLFYDKTIELVDDNGKEWSLAKNLLSWKNF